MYGVYRLAEHNIGIDSVYEQVQGFCKEYATEAEADLVIRTTPDMVKEEADYQEKSAARLGLYRPDRSLEYAETYMIYRLIADELCMEDWAVLHGSTVAIDGVGYIFTAKSGTGKSTHASLWRQVFGQRMTMINDDKPIIHFGEDAIEAYGSPWCGKHGRNTDTHVPVRAICILERGTDNHIKEIDFTEAYPMLIQQIHKPQDKEKMRHLLMLLDRLKGRVRFYRLSCNMEPEAALCAYEGMAEKR